jgi:tRNA pseudouridine65 synthase
MLEFIVKSLGRSVRLIKSDLNGLVALDKPAGVLSHPNPGKSGNSVVASNARCLLQGSYNPIDESYTIPSIDGPLQVWLLHRLDSATSGVVLAAVSREVADAVKQQFKLRLISKQYTAVVFDTSNSSIKSKSSSAFAWKDDLSINRSGGVVRAQIARREQLRGSSRAVTEVKVHGDKVSSCWRKLTKMTNIKVLNLTPLTGYSHQLRCQAAAHNYPIIGDKIYGEFKENKLFRKSQQARAGAAAGEGPSSKAPLEEASKRLFLHARELALNYELNGRTHAFHAVSPVPDSFYANPAQPTVPLAPKVPSVPLGPLVVPVVPVEPLVVPLVFTLETLPATTGTL